MSSRSTRARDRPRPKRGRRRDDVGRTPPRAPGLGDHRSALDWQQALIEEARRRARQRRLRYATLALAGGATIALVLGFVRGGGVGPIEISGAAGPSGRALHPLPLASSPMARSHSPTIWDGCWPPLPTALRHK